MTIKVEVVNTDETRNVVVSQSCDDSMTTIEPGGRVGFYLHSGNIIAVTEEDIDAPVPADIEVIDAPDPVDPADDGSERTE